MRYARNYKIEGILNIIFVFMVLLVTILVLISVGQNQVESDTLWHIKAGQWMLEHGISYTDPFSWSMGGKEWFAHEWLWEVSAAWIYNMWGHMGIWLFTCFWVTLFCGVLWILIRRNCSIPRAVLIYSIVIFSSAIFWNARPHPAAQGLFACTIYLLLSCRDYPKILFLLPPMMILWANIHGSAPLGVMLIAFYTLLNIICARLPCPGLSFSKLPPSVHRLLCLTTICTLFSSFINPHGIFLWTYMWNASRHPLITNYIIEWLSPNFHSPIFWPLILLPLCIFVLLALKKQDSKESLPLFEFILMCGFFFLAMQQRRHAPYYYFTSALVIAHLLRENSIKPIKLSLSLKTTLIMLTLVTFMCLSFFHPPSWIDEGDFFPTSATDYLLEHNLVNNIFNDYAYGGYLIWQGISPFIDGRADMYTFHSEVFKDYFGMTAGQRIRSKIKLEPSPQPYIDKYNFQTMLITSGSSLDLFLVHHPDWDEVFRNEKTVIYNKCFLVPSD